MYRRILFLHFSLSTTLNRNIQNYTTTCSWTEFYCCIYIFSLPYIVQQIALFFCFCLHCFYFLFYLSRIPTNFLPFLLSFYDSFCFNWTQHLYFSGKYEVGGSSQAQVVFHPDSYFPRSAKFNFTVDVLGASVNLLETAARFEGFETLVEQMFGPEGYFPDDRLMQLLNIKPTEAMARGRRSATENEMNEIKNNLEQLQDKVRKSVSYS